MSVLRREIGLSGAILLGLGSMVGSGVFVSLGLAAGVAAEGLLAAIVFAALLAMANALSSAQLAAAHPVSGGTYEYGRRYLSPALGFAAGWMFLCAKSASAATAALGAAGYMLALLGSRGAVDADATAKAISTPPPDPFVMRGVALVVVVVLTALVAGGIRRSNRTNAVIVSVTLAALAVLIVAVGGAAGRGAAVLPDFGRTVLGAPSLTALFEATALMFVAFTGYGRLATLGEEVRDPRRVIPRAIVVSMVVVTALYLAVAWVSLRILDGPTLERSTIEQAAPLEAVALAAGAPLVASIVAVGAVTAMVGVLLNLILGLSRVLFAMARHGDAPPALARIHARQASPVAAVIACGAAVAALAMIGNVKLSWSLSAFTVLLYYAITNLAALAQPRSERRYPRAIAVAGLIACLALAPFIEWRAWAIGLALLAVGFMLRAVLPRKRVTRST